MAAEDVEEFEGSSDWDALLMTAPPAAPAADEPEPDAARQPGKRRKKPAKRKPRKRAADSGYARLRDSWHTPVEDGSWGSDVPDGTPALVLRGLSQAEPVVITPDSEQGGFDEGEILFASQLLGTWDGGPSVHPRLLDLIYQAVRHFGAPYVNVVSGIRRDRKGSRHSHGLAADIVLPGVDDDALAAFFRPKGFVGVGTYPRGGFVHIDVREQSYFWVDRSAPGSRRSRMRQVRAEEAKAADEAALARGEGPLVNPEPLQKVLKKRAVRRNKGARRAKHEQPKRQRKKPDASRRKKAAPGDGSVKAPANAQPANSPTKKD